MVPMTLSSFIVDRPPLEPGVEMMLMWTTVSTSSLAITLAITGLRMSALTNDIPPTSPRGGTTSTPITRSTAGWSAAARANRRPRSRETPVTSTTRPATWRPYRLMRAGIGRGRVNLTTRHVRSQGRTARPRTSLAELATRDSRLLQQLAVLLLRHALATLLDDRTHGKPFENRLRLKPDRDS